MLLTVVVKPVGKPAEVRDIETEDVLRTFQELVGGYVEQVGVGPGVWILCNEDGLAQGLSDNCGLVGDLVFVQDVLGEEGYDWGSLDEENVHKALAWCRKHEREAHPDKSGGFHIISGDESIKEHLEKVAASAQSKVMEWESL